MACGMRPPLSCRRPATGTDALTGVGRRRDRTPSISFFNRFVRVAEDTVKRHNPGPEAHGAWWLSRTSNPSASRLSRDGWVRFPHASATRSPHNREWSSGVLAILPTCAAGGEPEGDAGRRSRVCALSDAESSLFKLSRSPFAQATPRSKAGGDKDCRAGPLRSSRERWRFARSRRGRGLSLERVSPVSTSHPGQDPLIVVSSQTHQIKR
jgi:hypothetical protein